MTLTLVEMETRRCIGGLTAREIHWLEEEDTELRLYTCAVCGKRNLYAVRDSEGKWRPEAHDEPLPRERSDAGEP